MTETPEIRPPKKRGPKATALTAFLALKPDIEAALKAGATRKTVYEKYRTVLGTEYVQFTLYVARHITKKEGGLAKRKPTGAAASPVTAPATDPAASAPLRNGPITTAATAPRKFQFDPTRANRPGRAEELL